MRGGIGHVRWFVAVCAAAALLAARTDVYEPLPAGVPQALVVVCLLVLPVAFGLAVGSWWAAFAALGLVVLPDLRTDSFHLLFLAVEVVILAVLIATGVVIGRLLPRSRAFALPLGLAGLLPLAVGAYRTIEPYDHVPARPIIVDARLGRMGSVRLGDEQLRERRDLDGAYTAHAAEGRVTFVTSGNRRVQTGRGVGNGDNLALVEQRHPSARCIVTPPAGEWGKTRYCVLRVGKVEVQFFDDPIRSVSVQRPSS